MHSSLVGVEAKYADVIGVAVLDELTSFGIDQSRVELTGHAGIPGMLSVGIIIDGAESSPMLIDTHTFKASLEGQMDLLRAWLRAGHPTQVAAAPIVQYRMGDRVHVPGAKEPQVAARDSYSSRVWVVSEREAQDPRAEPVPYLIFPDGSLVKEQQHGLPD